MTRLIDADALITAVFKKAIDDALFGGNTDMHKLLISIVAHQPTVDLRKVTQDYASNTTIGAVPQWIPCSERLPEIKGHYVSETCLVCLDNGEIGFSELQENIFGQVGWSCEREDDYHEPLGDVVAWMPLPKPYEVEND